VKLPLNNLSSHLRKSLSPCYLVCGDEPLLVQEALDAIRAAARDKGFDTRDLHIAARGFDWNDLSASGANLSLFSDKRIVELRLPTGKPGREGSACIAEMAAQPAEDTIFIVVSPKLEKRATGAKWVKALEAAGVFIEIWPVGARDLPGWISARMRQCGLAPDRDAVRLIADRVEGNLLAAQQEIEKLRLLNGEGPVSAADVENAVADSSRFDVYKLVDAAVGGDTARALRILDNVRAEGVEPPIVIWALTRELRVLVALAELVESGVDLSSALGKAGVWRSRQGIVRNCISRHRSGTLYPLMKAARRADGAAKGQLAGDPWQFFAEIVVGIAMGRAKAA
jgi:DNA polymerase-3 subunit delta